MQSVVTFSRVVWVRYPSFRKSKQIDVARGRVNVLQEIFCILSRSGIFLQLCEACGTPVEDAVILQKTLLRIIAYQFLSLWEIKTKHALRKNSDLSSLCLPLSVTLLPIEPVSASLWCWGQTLGFISESSRRAWLVAEGVGTQKSCGIVMISSRKADSRVLRCLQGNFRGNVLVL